MGLFRRNDDPTRPFAKNEVVLATRDLPGVPKGTRGKIKLVNGIDWIRYWVFFDNGVKLGSVDGSHLIRPRHLDWWRAEQTRREAEAAEAAEKGEAAAAEKAETAGPGAEAEASGDDPNAALRAMVPAHLLERSRAARERLGA